VQVYLRVLVVCDCHEFGERARYTRKAIRQRSEKARNGSSFPGRGKWLISSPKLLYQQWGPPNRLGNEYEEIFTRT